MAKKRNRTEQRLTRALMTQEEIPYQRALQRVRAAHAEIKRAERATEQPRAEHSPERVEQP
jgi:hypothetical protein